MSSAKYSMLEKELEKECKLQFGWFKPSKLNAVTGEAIRDKHKRELAQKKLFRKNESRKDVTAVAAATRKKVERINSLICADSGPRRKVVGKMNSNTKVISESKPNAKDAIVPTPEKRNKRMQSLVNVTAIISEKPKTEKKRKNSS